MIDMHVHSTTTTPLELARLASLNVRYVFLTGLQSDLAMWSTVDPARYLPALIPRAGHRLCHYIVTLQGATRGGELEDLSG